ncbi:BZ3500_MvSof-1268-A1-R1_Chr3-1g05554 [Microbotryum saponariae]|uniref:BZ3500_MvSof-1268-A1-R1_Chr3-1g05554 protein n=1 Tax=Microbotryum saponariae TaxID=289078 RepID=A0A2X0LCN4_9BASI|nr:BZ3500_MvSof-1268-A1-R1_Chr3-1g05554 [Microbotryum saponariae]SDA04744.1 BZ3501_MvSof-1269-A2-R1_Chr3-1g05224 [Microbotryum saponariae]
MVNSEVSLKPLLATNVPMIFTLLVPVNFTETGHRFVYLRDILEEVAELTGLALQEDSCFDYWVVDDAATSSTRSTPCLASCRYDQLAAFTAATDSSDKVLGLTGFVLDIDSLPAEATITLRVYEHIKARLPFVNITARPTDDFHCGWDTWLETLHSFTVDHPVLPSAVTLNDSDRTLVELHLQRAGYCTACNCIQIEVSPRRQFVVDWPLLISSLHLPSHSLETLSDVLASIVGQPLKLYRKAKNSGRRHHKRNCPGGSYVQFVSITSLPRVIVININNMYPEHSLAPAELRFGVSDQMPEMVWRLRSGVYNINNSHFVTNATVGYGQEATRYHFDAIKGSLARPIGDRNAGGLVSVLFYELEEESFDFLQAFNLILTRQWHEMWSLYHEPSDPTDIGIKVQRDS